MRRSYCALKIASVPIGILALVLGTLSVALGGSFSGEVVGVIDGDSIRVMHNGKTEQIRLNGIDCPEKKQPFGTRAKQFTSKKAFGKDVTVKESGRDRYGRTLAEVSLPDGRSLNQELLKAGLAWGFRKYSKDLRLRDLEDEARIDKLGLWADPDPVPLWEWRRQASSPMLGASHGEAANTVTITNIDQGKGVATVRNDATGAHYNFTIEITDELQALKIGQILRAPAVQPRSSESGKDQSDEGGCYERCRVAGSTILECLYWCANR